MNRQQLAYLKTAVEIIEDRISENESSDGDMIALEGARDLVQLVLEAERNGKEPVAN